MVTGASGMLGTDVIKELQRRGIAHTALDRAACDITNYESCKEAIYDFHPAALINCAAYTDVNGAETNESAAVAINATGPACLARACAEFGTFLVHVSTDYVFDGSKPDPYHIYDHTNPINVYGKSKLLGELSIIEALPPIAFAIVRTSCCKCPRSTKCFMGTNFVKTMLRVGREGKDLKVIHDQVGAPTYTVDLARTLVEIAVHGCYGIFHATGSGSCSWFEFAEEIFRLAGITPASFVPCAAEEFPTPARRPSNSRLAEESLLDCNLPPLPHWKDALKRYLEETGELSR